MTTRTGLFPKHKGVVAPVYDDLRLTVPAREALERAGNRVTPSGSTVERDPHGDPTVPPSLRPRIDVPTYRVVLCGDVPRGLVLCLIGQGAEQHGGLRLDDEPEYPGEWPASAVAWHERGEWTPCPACGAALVWYEAGYVPGYRVCARAPHHHAQLSELGGPATLVSR